MRCRSGDCRWATSVESGAQIMQERVDDERASGGGNASSARPGDALGDGGSGVSFDHASVMLDEIVETLSEVPDGLVVDATLGGAGHASALLAANDGLSILGLDRDEMALGAAEARLAPHGERVAQRHTRFDGLADAVHSLGVEHLSGALFDLGVSSQQLDLADRGFSFRHDGPLDMRMDRSQGPTAADLVNSTDEGALVGILQRNGDERHARRIARAIVAARPLHTTAELAEVVRDAVPLQLGEALVTRRKTFQAIRIEINDELVILEDALRQALDLRPDGAMRGAGLSLRRGPDREERLSVPCRRGTSPASRSSSTTRSRGHGQAAVARRTAPGRGRDRAEPTRGGCPVPGRRETRGGGLMVATTQPRRQAAASRTAGTASPPTFALFVPIIGWRSLGRSAAQWPSPFLLCCS